MLSHRSEVVQKPCVAVLQTNPKIRDMIGLHYWNFATCVLPVLYLIDMAMFLSKLSKIEPCIQMK